MARKATVMDQSARLPEPDILKDDVLREGLARLARFAQWQNGVKYRAPGVDRANPRLSGADTALRDALRRWRSTPTCPADAAAVACGLVGAFPNTRVDAASFAMGLAAVVEDERGLTADIVRAVARKVRAEKRSLPPIADLRDAMMAEANARWALLHDLESYEPEWQRLQEKERAEAERLVTAAARVGVTITPDEVLLAWSALDAGNGGWMHQRTEYGKPERNYHYIERWTFDEIARGGPHAEQAARLLVLLAPHEAEREVALAKVLPSMEGLHWNAPEWQAWRKEWPNAGERYASEIEALGEAFGLVEVSA